MNRFLDWLAAKPTLRLTILAASTALALAAILIAWWLA